MNAPMTPSGGVPTSQRRSSRWPNLVWAIPLIALGIVGYLGVEAMLNRGETITVTFDRAAGARAGETKVLYQGVEAGQLIKIEPNKDGRSLDFKLRMVPEAKAGLNTNARFWLIGATPNFSDLSSLKSVLSGVTVGYAPGEGGAATQAFHGLEKAPVILPSDKGTRFRLSAQNIGSIQEGASVLLRGQSIGKVIEVKLDGEERFNLEVFVFAPFDALITADARFWKISPLRVSFNDGISANLAPITSILNGGIDVDTHPNGTESGARAHPEQQFILYESRGAARAGLAGPAFSYELLFKGDAGILTTDTAVTLLGFEIGQIRSVRLTYDPRSGEPQTLAVADIFPAQMNVQAQGDQWRNATNDKLELLMRAGYRARLKQALLGEPTIALIKTGGVSQSTLGAGDHPRFPTDIGIGFDDLSKQANELLAHLNSLPFAKIGSHLAAIGGRVEQFVNSKELEQGLVHAGASVASLDAILSTARPQIGPLLEHLKDTADQLADIAQNANRLLQNNGNDANLNDAVQQLTDAAHSIRSLSDYLARHPEALLRGKRPDR